MRWTALLIALSFLVACHSPRTIAEIAGIYTMSTGGGLDSIELEANGTYRHAYTTEDGRSDHQSGRWHLEALQAGQTVVLSDFQPLLGEQTRGAGTYLLLLKVNFGKIRLITNIDLDAGYTKK